MICLFIWETGNVWRFDVSHNTFLMLIFDPDDMHMGIVALYNVHVHYTWYIAERMPCCYDYTPMITCVGVNSTVGNTITLCKLLVMGSHAPVCEFMG